MNRLETIAYAVVIVGAGIAESWPGVDSGQQGDRVQGSLALVASQYATIFWISPSR